MICVLYSVPAQAAREVIAAPATIRDFHDSLNEDKTIISLEKSWHGLHFTLTGTSWEGDPPLNFLTIGGEPIGQEAVGIGPARIFWPAQVVTLNTALASITEAEFDRRFDLAQLAAEDVYPSIWDEPREDLLAEYWESLQDTQAFISNTAEAGHALIITIG